MLVCSEYFMNFGIFKITSFVSSHETRRPLFITFILWYFFLFKVLSSFSFPCCLKSVCLWKLRDRTCPHQLLNAHNSHQVFLVIDDWPKYIYIVISCLGMDSVPAPAGGRWLATIIAWSPRDKWNSNWMFSVLFAMLFINSGLKVTADTGLQLGFSS